MVFKRQRCLGLCFGIFTLSLLTLCKISKKYLLSNMQFTNLSFWFCYCCCRHIIIHWMFSCLLCMSQICLSKPCGRDFPGAPLVNNLPCSVGDVGLIPGQRTKIPHATVQLSLCRSYWACLPQLERTCIHSEGFCMTQWRSCVPQLRPDAASQTNPNIYRPRTMRHWIMNRSDKCYLRFKHLRADVQPSISLFLFHDDLESCNDRDTEWKQQGLLSHCRGESWCEENSDLHHILHEQERNLCFIKPLRFQGLFIIA